MEGFADYKLLGFSLWREADVVSTPTPSQAIHLQQSVTV